MKKWALATLLAAVQFIGQAQAAEWSPIEMEGNTVREVDMDSITRNGPVVLFSARHTFGDSNEYRVERRAVKYLLIRNRANCSSRTLAQLATEAYDEKMAQVGKQKIQLAQDLPVTPGSIDEATLNFICAPAK